jgi:hypothetical protein
MTNYDAVTNDGYSVVINADDLMTMANKLESHDAKGFQAREQLLQTIVPEAAFGSVPGGAAAAAKLKESMGHHLDAITAMGVNVSDFAARVDAAGQLAAEAEPDTVKVSRIPAPFDDSTGS